MNSLRFSLLVLVASSMSLLIRAEEAKKCEVGEQCSVLQIKSRHCRPLEYCPEVSKSGVCDADQVCKTVGEPCTFYTNSLYRIFGVAKKTGTVQIKSDSPHNQPQLYCTDTVAPMSSHKRPEQHPISHPLGVK